MDKRFTFNEDAMNYEKWRPTYCEELFHDIMEYSKLDMHKKTLEIGIGTGKATLPFLKTGCDLRAIELGENLAEFSKNKFKDYKNFNINVMKIPLTLSILQLPFIGLMKI